MAHTSTILLLSLVMLGSTHTDSIYNHFVDYKESPHLPMHIQWNQDETMIRQIYGIAVPSEGYDSVSKARSFIIKYHQYLGIPSQSQLVAVNTFTRKKSTTVRFQQYINNIVVLGGFVSITFSTNDNITNYQAQLYSADTDRQAVPFEQIQQALSIEILTDNKYGYFPPPNSLIYWPVNHERIVLAYVVYPQQKPHQFVVINAHTITELGSGYPSQSIQNITR